MFRLAICFVLLTASAVIADEVKTSPNGMVHTEKPIYDLPEDAGQYHITVFGRPGEAKYEAVKRAFRDDPHLQSYRSQLHFTVVDFGSAMYKQRYSGTVTTLPTIRISYPSGRTMYQLQGYEIPISAEALANTLAPQIEWCRPRPAPEPTPAPIDVPPPAPSVPLAPPAPRYNWVLFSALVAAGALGGVGVGAARTWRQING